jgi:hypothetical protein
MAKVLNLRNIQNKVQAVIIQKVVSGPILRDVGEFVRTRIYESTKKGKSLVTGSAISGLSGAYKNYRKRFQEWNQTGEFFSPPRSNLTLTGQMLRALRYVITRGARSSHVDVDVAPTKRSATPQVPLKSWVEGRSEKKFRKITKQPEDLNNAEVAKRVAKEGRPFIGLDATGRNRVKLMIANELRTRLRQAGLKK